MCNTLEDKEILCYTRAVLEASPGLSSVWQISSEVLWGQAVASCDDLYNQYVADAMGDDEVALVAEKRETRSVILKSARPAPEIKYTQEIINGDEDQQNSCHAANCDKT